MRFKFQEKKKKKKQENLRQEEELDHRKKADSQLCQNRKAKVANLKGFGCQKTIQI